MALSVRDRLALASSAAALLALAVGGWMLLSPSFAEPEPGLPAVDLLSSADPVASATAMTSADVVVDVEGGVARAGIVVLPGGSRVADAIAAAGGYGPDADLAAAASGINLAAPLSDGQQVYVPRVGEAGGGSGAGANAGGLVNLNTASPEALEALPGIGPVTVQRIVAARAERPFTTLEELVERDVMHNGQLEDIRDLVTL